MATVKLVSWNVNGIRAVAKKGLFEWFETEDADVLCLQETKIDALQLPEHFKNRPGYLSYFSHAEKKGYSGVAIYTREKPLSVKEGLGIKRFDAEGRVLVADFGDFTLLNIYYPNGKASPERLQYKLDFYDAFFEFAQDLSKKGKKLIVCGDVNTAHRPIDLARPKDNENISGFLPVERAWLDKFVGAGYLDTFREVNSKPDNYTWWHLVTRARERNVGWRIDYFFVSDALKGKLVNATIEPHVQGSDHCPVTLSLKI
ncbi:MAG: exodeoxyribonuclease III [Candidatus Melainabacteria bacterium]|nr:MAG: exodeoxyribonuclease III [Candidatus Melainabacteria bacterium]